MACLVTYALAYVSYNFYEKWFLQWKDFKWRR
jgi:peptidoglycan/LPS O-acetylase OafA/YrhL